MAWLVFTGDRRGLCREGEMRLRNQLGLEHRTFHEHNITTKTVNLGVGKDQPTLEFGQDGSSAWVLPFHCRWVSIPVHSGRWAGGPSRFVQSNACLA